MKTKNISWHLTIFKGRPDLSIKSQEVVDYAIFIMAEGGC